MKYFAPPAIVCSLLISASCTQNSQKLVASGNAYHQEKKYKEASILYRKAIAKDKKNAEAYYREGLNLIDQRNPFEASKFLRRAVDLRPDNVDAETKLAEIYLFVYASNPKKFKTLLTDVRDLTARVSQHDPGSFDGIRLQAMSSLADKNTDKALENFAAANRMRPHSREIVGWYAETLVTAKRSDEAQALARDMIAHDKTWGPAYDFLFVQFNQQNSPEKAEAVLRERLGNDPTSPAAISNLATYLVATNRFGEAETLMHRVVEDRKAFPNGREMLGDFYLRANKLDQALEQYQAAIKADQKNALPYQQRVLVAYSMMGRREDALRLARELAAKNPKDRSTNEIYGMLIVEAGPKGDGGKWLTELESLVQKNPADAALHLDLARAYLSSHQSDKSLTEALEAIREQPNLTDARMLAARLYEDAGQHSKALEQTDVVLGAQPGNADVRLIRDLALIGLNEADRAVPEIEALLQEHPQMNDARSVLANVYVAQKRYEKASEQFEQMWKSNPPDNRGLLGLQTVKLAEGKGDEAVATLQAFVDKNPQALPYRYQLANVEAAVSLQSRRSDQAQKVLVQRAADNYKEILKSTPNAPDVWLRLGVMQRQLGEYDEALASFEQAGAINPRNAEAFLNRAMLLEALGRTKEAGEAYNKVLGIDPENPLALNNVAFLNAQAGANLDQAMTFAERAKKKYPNNPEISDTLGFIYYQKNLTPEAVRIFRQVVEDEPKNSTFHLHLAMALLKQGDKQGARDEAGKALQNAAQADERNKIRSFVSQIG